MTACVCWIGGTSGIVSGRGTCHSGKVCCAGCRVRDEGVGLDSGDVRGVLQELRVCGLRPQHTIPITRPLIARFLPLLPPPGAAARGPRLRRRQHAHSRGQRGAAGGHTAGQDGGGHVQRHKVRSESVHLQTTEDNSMRFEHVAAHNGESRRCSGRTCRLCQLAAARTVSPWFLLRQWQSLPSQNLPFARRLAFPALLSYPNVSP